MWNLSQRAARALNDAMAGWICLALTLGYIVCTVRGVSVSTEYHSFVLATVAFFVSQKVRDQSQSENVERPEK